MLGELMELLPECAGCTKIRRRISQNLRSTPDSRLRLMAHGSSGKWYRMKWLRDHGIAQNRGSESYLKARLGAILGANALKRS